MKGIAITLRDLDRIISGECDDLNEGSREMLVTMLELAHRRAKSPPKKPKLFATGAQRTQSKTDSANPLRSLSLCGKTQEGGKP